MLYLKITTGMGMMALTIIIHALFMETGAKMARWRQSHLGKAKTEAMKAALLSGLTVWLFLAIVLEQRMFEEDVAGQTNEDENEHDDKDDLGGTTMKTKSSWTK